MKKNLLSKLGLLVLCFGLTAGLSACGGGGEAAPAEQAEEGATDDGTDAGTDADTEGSAEGEGEAAE